MTVVPRKLSLILLLYLLLATTHSIVVPLTFGNDEWMHFRYIRFIYEHGRLPLTWAERNDTGYKADSPPLYHLLVAAAVAPLPSSPPLRLADTPRRQLADNIIVTDTPLLYTIDQAWPYRGEVLIWHVGRGISIFFGLTLIVITYYTALELQLRPQQARIAASFVAFTPAIIFHSSVLSYESFSATLTALLLLLALKLLRHPAPPHKGWFTLGFLAGLAIITKYSALLLPVELIVIAWLALKPPAITLQFLKVNGFMLLGLAVAVSGWFGFVIVHFNTIATQGVIVGLIDPIFVGDASDTTSVQVAQLLFNNGSTTPPPPKPRDYLALSQAFINSFWSAPITGYYLPYLPLIATTGLLILMSLNARALLTHFTPLKPQLILLLLHTGLIIPILLLRISFSYDALEAAQGRHILMPAASAIAILITAYGQHRLRRLATMSLAVGLCLWSVWGQIGAAIMAYPPPLQITSTPNLPPGQGVILAQAMQLNQATWQLQPDHLQVTLSWQALAPMPQDYLIQLQLLDSTQQRVSQIIGQPLRGRYPTRAWEVGDKVTDVYDLPLFNTWSGRYKLQLQLLSRQGQPITEPQSLGDIFLNLTLPPPPPCRLYPHAEPTYRHLSKIAYRPFATLTLFSPETPRLVASDETTQTPLISANAWHTFMVEPHWYQSYRLQIGAADCGLIHFDIPPRSFTLPTIPMPLQVNFNNEIELLGYDLPTRRIGAGERLPVTLYWRSLAYMGYDYQIFDNLLDQNQRRWGGYDRQPLDKYSTLLWSPGETITDAFGVPIDPAAPNGIYTLDVGLYQQTPQGAKSLPLMGSNPPQNSLRLGPIKIGGPPPGLTLPQVHPQFPAYHAFADSLVLLGYDLTISPTLQLTLYWQATGRPTQDYTTFVHLRDPKGQNMAQHDSPPGQNNYPTSLWDKGDIIPQFTSMADLPPGHYQLVIGLYERETGQRLSLTADQNHELLLQEITWQP